MAEIDTAERLTRLEQAFADERRARQACEARLETALQQLTQAVSAAQAAFTAAITAEQAERERMAVQQEADRVWLAALAEHVKVAQQENHEWVAAEQSARIALEAAILEVKRQAGSLAEPDTRPFEETSLRAEILALSHVVDDLAAAVFPADPAPGP